MSIDTIHLLSHFSRENGHGRHVRVVFNWLKILWFFSFGLSRLYTMYFFKKFRNFDHIYTWFTRLCYGLASFEAIKKTTVQDLSGNNYPSQTAIQRAYPSQQSALRDYFTLAIFVMQEQSRLARCVVKVYNIVRHLILKGGWVNPTCHLRGSYRTNFGFVLASRKQGLAPVSEGDPIVFGWDKKNPRLKYTPTGPLI